LSQDRVTCDTWLCQCPQHETGRCRVGGHHKTAKQGDFDTNRADSEKAMRQLTCGLDHRSELEERMATGVGEVLLGLVIDADPAPQQDGDGWPHAWPE
jgi:hypothetical protein